jgi:aspartate racemase
VNHASVPDRTAFLLGDSTDNPLPDLLEDVTQYSVLNPEFFVLACNTAHFFINDLQAATDVPILNMVDNAAQGIAKSGDVKRLGVLATEGTIKAGIYKDYIENCDMDYVVPTGDLQAKVTEIIYTLKATKELKVDLYHEVIDAMMTDMNCDAVVLACTELSVFYASDDVDTPANVFDAQDMMVETVIKRLGK